MHAYLIATTALLVALSGPVMAQQQPAAGAAEVAPAPGPTEGTAGGTTAHAREHLPDTPEAPIDAESVDAAHASEGTAPGAGSTGVVDEAMVRELHQMGLEQQKRAATPPPTKSEETKAAEQKAIASHRDAFFARIEQGS